MQGRQLVDLRASPTLWSFSSFLTLLFFRHRPVMLQSAAAALSSLATLSLSGSPPQGVPQTGTSFASASGQLASSSTSRMLKVEAKDDDIVLDDPPVAAPVKAEINGAGISVTKTGKKRGTIFKCESCSKVRTL